MIDVIDRFLFRRCVVCRGEKRQRLVRFGLFWMVVALGGFLRFPRFGKLGPDRRRDWRARRVFVWGWKMIGRLVSVRLRSVTLFRLMYSVVESTILCLIDKDEVDAVGRQSDLHVFSSPPLPLQPPLPLLSLFLLPPASRLTPSSETHVVDRSPWIEFYIFVSFSAPSFSAWE